MLRKKMEKKNDLCERLMQFAVDVTLYLRTVKNTIETIDTKRQLIKASTSSGANYEESQGSPTKPDVRTKIGIALKEMREANYFLRIYNRLKLGDFEKSVYLVNESSELKLILASILNKLLLFFLFSCCLKLEIWGLGF
jgi:four helix bundle protein